MPLHWAALNNRLDLAELLINNNADVNAKDDRGFTPLHWAAHYSNTDIELLLQANGDEIA